MDAKDKWAGGKAHLVQTGDLLDRGKDARKVLDLLMRLEGEARKAGGRVHALLGNHEVMNMLGDLRYVNAEEYKSFQEPESTRRREHFYEAALFQARKSAKAAGTPFDEDAFQREVPAAGAARLRRADGGALGGGPVRQVAAPAAGHREGQRCRLRPRGTHPRGGGPRLRGDQRQGAAAS